MSLYKHQINALLLGAGYVIVPASMKKYAECLYQKVVRKDNGKRFINIYQYDMSEVSTITPLTFTIEVAFETSDEHETWFTAEFYNLKPVQLLEALSFYEKQLLSLYDVLGGKDQ